jgi:hypothetical protein
MNTGRTKIGRFPAHGVRLPESNGRSEAQFTGENKPYRALSGPHEETPNE